MTQEESSEADLVQMLDEHIQDTGVTPPDAPIETNTEPPSGPTSQVNMPIPSEKDK